MEKSLFSIYDAKINHLVSLFVDNGPVTKELMTVFFGDPGLCEYLHFKSCNYLGIYKSRGSLYLDSAKFVVLASFSLIALRKYDGDIWGHIYQKYSEIKSKYPNVDFPFISSQVFQNSARKILDNYFIVKNSKFVDVPLSFAIVSSNYMVSFYDFVESVFDNNFSGNPYFDEDKGLCMERINLFLDNFSVSFTNGGGEEDDNVQIKLGKVKLTYKLTKYTRDALSSANKKNKESIVFLLLSCLSLIRDYRYDKVEKNQLPFFLEPFSIWKQNQNEIVSKAKRRTREMCLEEFNPKPYFFRNGNTFLIKTQYFQVGHNVDIDSLIMEIDGLSEKILVPSDSIRRDDIIGGYQIYPFDIKIPLPVGKIRLIVRDRDMLIFDSGETLFRDVIFFDNQLTSKEIKPNTNFRGDATCVSKNPPEKTPLAATEEIAGAEGYRLYQFYISDSNIYVVDGRGYRFSSDTKPVIVADYTKTARAIDHNGTYIDIATSLTEIQFDLPLDSKNVFCEYNGSIIDCEGYLSTLAQNGLSKRVSLDLSFIQNGSVDLNVVSVKGSHFSFVLDNSFSILMDTGCVFAHFLNEDEVAETKDSDQSVDISFKFYKLNIIIPSFQISLDGSTWRSEKTLNTEDLSPQSKLWVACDESTLCHYGFGSFPKEIMATKKEFGRQEFDIGFLVFPKDSFEPLPLIFDSEYGHHQIDLYYGTAVVKDESRFGYDYLDKSFFFSFKITGKSQVKVEIKSKKTGAICYEDDNYSSGQTVSIKCLEPFIDYSLSVFAIKKGILGESAKKIYSRDISFISEKCEKGDVLKMKSVNVLLGDENDNTEIRKIEKEAYVLVTGVVQDEENAYTCLIYDKGASHTRIYYKYNNIVLTFDDRVEKDGLWFRINFDGDMFYYNPYARGVPEKEDGDKYVLTKCDPIDSFLLTGKGKL